MKPHRRSLFVIFLALTLSLFGRASLIQAASTPGSIWAWGNNGWGQLGRPGGATSAGTVNPDPTMVTGISGFTAISGGTDHTMALRKDGTVWTWGSNYYGQLGTTSTTGSSAYNIAPAQVPGLTNVTQIAAGSEFSVALRSNGTIWAWGINRAGQLGNSTNLGTSNPNITPLQVQGISGVIAIAATSHHTLAIKKDGTLWAWGYNYFGELGQPGGSTGILYNKVPKKVPGLAGVVAIGTGEYHSLAVLNDGTVWAWGSNMYTQLGNRTNEGVEAPNPVPVQVAGIPGVQAVSGGNSWSLALKSDGTVWAWGQNAYGQLGTATGTGTNLGSAGNFPTPAQIDGLANMIAIACGSEHNIALKSDGTVWTWGYNYNGQLGNHTNIRNPSDPNSTAFAANPIPTSVQGIVNTVGIDAGDDFSIALTKQPPVAVDFTQQLISNVADIRIKLQASDPQGNPLTYSIVTPPQHGMLTAPSGSYVTYTPDATLTTGDSFTFRAANGPNASNQSNVATCTIVPNHAPSIVSLIPSKLDGTVSGSGGSSTVGEPLKLALKVTDPEGATRLKTLYVTFNRVLSNANGIVLSYDQAFNKLYLRSDDGKTLLGGQTVGSAGTVENSYGVLDFSQSTVVKSGNNIAVNFVVIPKTPFTGARKLWGAVRDTGGLQDGYDLMATWTVNPAPPTLQVKPAADKPSANSS